MTPDHQSKIEKLEKNLYSPNSKFQDPNERRHLHERRYDLEKSWQDENTVIDVPVRQNYFFKVFLGISILFFVLASGYAIYNFTSNKSTYSDDHIEMDISGPIAIGGGEPLKLDVHIANNNTVPLEAVDIVVKYPTGSKRVDDVAEDLTTTREGLGDISSGKIVQRTLDAVLFGEENEKKQIEVTIEYTVPNSDAIFEKKKMYNVVLSGSPIRVTLESLKEIQAGQEAQLEVTINSNSNTPLRDVLVRMEYPFGFTFKSANPAPTIDTNVWKIGELKPQETKKIVIKGPIEGEDEEERVFKVSTGIMDQMNEKQVGVLLSRSDYSMKIKKPFLGVNFSVNGSNSQDTVIGARDLTFATINWRNNLSTVLNDVQIEAKFAGAVLNRTSVSADRGFYRSLDNTVVWNSETLPKFAMLDAGEAGQVGFNFATFANAQGSQLYKNPELSLVITVKGNRITDNNVPEEIKSTVTKRIKVMTDITTASKSYYLDGPFKNTGPYPPKQEQPTTYTLNLTVANTANAVSNARIVAKIPSYVQWENVISPTTEKVSYDPVSRDLIWNIGDIAPGVGYSSNKKELFMQVTLLPSVSQVGTNPNLANQIFFEGVDTFTGRTIRQEISSITINTDDKVLVTGRARVSE